MSEFGKDANEEIRRLSDAVESLGSRQGRSWLSYVPILTTLLTILVTYLSYENSQSIEANKNSIEALNAKIAQTHLAIADRQAEAGLGLQIFRDTSSVIPSEGDERRRVVLKLLEALAIGYREEADLKNVKDFIVQLEQEIQQLAIIQAAQPGAATDPKSTNEAKAIAAEAAFAIADADYQVRAPGATIKSPSAVQTASPPAPSPAPSAESNAGAKVQVDSYGTAVSPGRDDGWDYDVFWCPRNDANKTIADLLFDGLVKRQGPDHLGRVRLRQIPDKMQHSPDYARLDGVVIRRHESKAAEATILKGWAEADLKAAGQKPDTVQIQPSNQVLKYYLSIFACAP